MLQIVLIRPGSTAFDSEGRIQGTLDVPLSEAGNEQVAAICAQLADAHLEIIYSSPCQSSLETAEAVAKRVGVKYKEVEKLRNLDHGLWQGMRLEEVKRKQPRVFKQWREHPETICPPEGEMVEPARRRVEEVLAKIVKKHKHGVVGLVVPEPLASLAQACLCRQPPPEVMKSTPACGTWQTFGVGAEASAS
ncbi:MAG: histidine phosphatase family protein [Pirellulales bacterium]